MQPKYSILIPTRNGISYLPYAIKSVLSQQFSSVELIVSDNYSTDGTAAYLQTLNDPRLKVTRPDRELAMSAHYEFVLSQARGDWVTILGDDDAVMPYFFNEIEKLIALHNDIEAIACRRAYYFWPGCEDVYGETVTAYQSRNLEKLINSKFSLFMCLCSISVYTDTPQLYTGGLIHRSLIDKIKEESNGKFYFATSPDVYSAVVLAFKSGKYLRIETPLFWVGTSPKSVGLSGSSKAQSNERAVEFWTQCKFDGFVVNDAIPPELFDLREGALYVYDAVLNSPLAGKFWRSSFVKHMVYAGLIAKNHSLKAEIELRVSRDVNRAILNFVAYPFVLLQIIHKFGVISDRAMNRLFSKQVISNVRSEFPNIEKASDAVMRLRIRA